MRRHRYSRKKREAKAKTMFSSNSKLSGRSTGMSPERLPRNRYFSGVFAAITDASARSELTHHRQLLTPRARLEDQCERARAVGRKHQKCRGSGRCCAAKTAI